VVELGGGGGRAVCGIILVGLLIFSQNDSNSGAAGQQWFIVESFAESFTCSSISGGSCIFIFCSATFSATF
jgi:hypothetical protein